MLSLVNLTKKDKKNMSNERYKEIIIALVEEIEDQQILISIYTVIKNLIE